MAGLRNWKMEIGNSRHDGVKPSFRFPVSNFQFRVSSFQFPVSSFVSRAAKRLACLGVIMIALHYAPAARAQGCAMCYTSASAAKQAALEALQNGIIILLAPPLLMFVGIFWLAFRRRNVQEAGVIDPEEVFDAHPPDRKSVV